MHISIHHHIKYKDQSETGKTKPVKNQPHTHPNKKPNQLPSPQLQKELVH